MDNMKETTAAKNLNTEACLMFAQDHLMCQKSSRKMFCGQNKKKILAKMHNALFRGKRALQIHTKTFPAVKYGRRITV